MINILLIIGCIILYIFVGIIFKSYMVNSDSIDYGFLPEKLVNFVVIIGWSIYLVKIIILRILRALTYCLISVPNNIGKVLSK